MTEYVHDLREYGLLTAKLISVDGGTAPVSARAGVSIIISASAGQFDPVALVEQLESEARVFQTRSSVRMEAEQGMARLLVVECPLFQQTASRPAP